MEAIFKQLRKNADKVGESNDSAGAKLKSKAALIISVFAAIFSVNAFIQGQLNSGILNNTIKINDTWAFYQAKSIKQTQYELAADAIRDRDQQKYAEYRATVERYETEPGEGKRDLMTKAKSLETERDLAKKRSPWIGIAGSLMQIAIVLMTASILSAGIMMFYGGIIAMSVALGVMSQGLFLWF